MYLHLLCNYYTLQCILHNVNRRGVVGDRVNFLGQVAYKLVTAYMREVIKGVDVHMCSLCWFFSKNEKETDMDNLT